MIMKFSFVSLIFALLSTHGFCDLVPPSQMDLIAMSKGGNAILRLGTFSPSSVHRWNNATGTYDKVCEEWSDFTVTKQAESNQVGPFGDPILPGAHLCTIDDFAEFAATFDIQRGSAGMRIYDIEGKKIAAYMLNEILSNEEIKSCTQTTTTIQWVDQVEFHEDYIFVSGPSKNIKGSLGTHSVIKGYSDDNSFEIYIDTENLSIFRKPYASNLHIEDENIRVNLGESKMAIEATYRFFDDDEEDHEEKRVYRLRFPFPALASEANLLQKSIQLKINEQRFSNSQIKRNRTLSKLITSDYPGIEVFDVIFDISEEQVGDSFSANLTFTQEYLHKDEKLFFLYFPLLTYPKIDYSDVWVNMHDSKQWITFSSSGPKIEFAGYGNKLNDPISLGRWEYFEGEVKLE